ncbi:MAG: ATP-dependent protease [Epsilonproteobacteria bacterium (ex Lamellibrachia satsuma)]|nr:MAG: ATP-dependent protease [Epsilonproteobacteria bacterium (ex Lamellibrachia satsuma)]
MIKPLNVDKLYTHCNLGIFDFKTTAELEDLDEIIGQSRALKAISFGIGIKKEGYNLYAMGKLGSGKHSVVEKFIQSRAKEEEKPGDWCYVNNFEDPRKPISLKLRPSMGIKLKDDMEELIEELKNIIPAIYESEEYREKKQSIIDKFNEIKEQSFESLKEKAKQESIAIRYTASGYTLSPISKENKILEKEEYQALSDKKKAQIQEKIKKFTTQIENTAQDMMIKGREQQKEIRELERNMTKKSVDNSIDDLKKKYQDYDKILTYLESVEEDIIKNSQDFLPATQTNLFFMGIRSTKDSGIFNKYRVNVLVSHKDVDGAPIIYENNPTYANLFGEIEHIAQMGTLLTDFNLIKAGALHKANGGYLILDASKVLMQPFVWEGLKRMLRSGEIRIESLAQSLSLISTLTLEPETIALDIKIVLIGSRILYYLLYNYDPEFKELFKINADFENDTPRNDENSLLYAKMIGMIARDNALLPLDREAVGKVIEYSSRLAEDSQKLSTHLGSLNNLLQEADFIARQKKKQKITKANIVQAIVEKIERSDRIKDRMYEAIQRGTILIQTAGKAIGQVNGVAIMDLGNFSFGHPLKITALTRLGKRGVVNIEREAKLSGPMHDKGIMILSAYLAATYAKDFPLSMTATLVFEQSYGKVEGDSASCAELFALLSSLSERALDQSIAATGSINQNGQVQAVGGINEKIEGFFDVCSLVSSTKRNGIIIPASNVKHLMLKEEVLEAVKNGTFEIYAIESIDEGMEILTGKKSGKKDSNGKFPKRSTNYLVEEKLKLLANKSKRKKI